MPKTPKIGYSNQRPKKNPPHVRLGDLRGAMGLTLDQVIERVSEESDLHITRGALSGIENGHRGVSAPLLRALTAAYGLRPGAITTDYEPRERETENVA